MTHRDLRIEWGARLLIEWLRLGAGSGSGSGSVVDGNVEGGGREAFSGAEQLAIERTIARRKEWVGIFFGPGTENLDKIYKRLVDTRDGQLLCDVIFWTFNQYPAQKHAQVDIGWVI